MRHVIRWSCLALALFAFSTPLEAQNKPKPGGKTATASAADYQQFLGAGEITGKIARIDHVKRLITVQVEVHDAQADAKDALRQQQQAARNLLQRPGHNPAQQARQAQQQIAQAQRQQIQALNKANNGAKAHTVTKEFEFQAEEKAKVRLMNLPQEFDERGKPRQYTQQELRELKGPNSSLPGYRAEFEDLAVGQTVKLYVAAPKSQKTSTTKPAKDKAKDADDDKDAPLTVDPTKNRATMVLIVKDVEGTSRNGKDAPKKK